MSRIKKLIHKIRKKPTPRNITLNEFKKFGMHYGFELKDGSKHKCLIHEKNGSKFPFPVKGYLVDHVYIKQFLNLIDELNLTEKEE